MNIDSELVLITVHKGPIKDLIKTLKSIDNQILKPKLNVVVVRNISFYEIKLFRNKKRIFIINKDKSIYNAMNIALSYKNISNTSPKVQIMIKDNKYICKVEAQFSTFTVRFV